MVLKYLEVKRRYVQINMIYRKISKLNKPSEAVWIGYFEDIYIEHCKFVKKYDNTYNEHMLIGQKFIGNPFMTSKYHMLERI